MMRWIGYDWSAVVSLVILAPEALLTFMSKSLYVRLFLPLQSRPLTDASEFASASIPLS